jgi:hypothetical protein
MFLLLKEGLGEGEGGGEHKCETLPVDLNSTKFMNLKLNKGSLFKLSYFLIFINTFTHPSFKLA